MIHAESSPAQLPVVVGFDDVNLAFGSTPALVHVSFSMRAGETRVVLGAAGSGKTMLLKSAVGLVAPDSGHISLFGEEVTGRKESQLYDVRSKLGTIPPRAMEGLAASDGIPVTKVMYSSSNELI